MTFWARGASLCLLTLALATRAFAAVERLEVTQSVPFAGGAPFGAAGPYEKIRGIAHFALDPNAPANARIVDLKLAPRDSRGLVEFEAPFLMLRPRLPGGGALIYEVNNRGGIGILGQIDGRSPAANDPTTAADVGDALLLRRGYTLLWSGWTWDVAPAPGVRALTMTPPRAKGVRGALESEIIVPAPAPVVAYAGMRGVTYPPATPDDPAARLAWRERPDGPLTPIPRARWRFLPPEEAGGAERIALEGGFQPGRIYILTYEAKGPYVEGAGLAGIRDLLSYLRSHPLAGAPPPSRVLIFGISQSARVIGRMLLDGLDVGEDGRLAFDGAFLQVPGGGGGAGFNSRFAQPTRHPSMLEEHDFPADAFPFSTARSTDRVSGRTDSALDRARDAAGRLPKLIYANTSTEFWNRDASLIATTDDGARDLDPPANVRLYAFMGA